MSGSFEFSRPPCSMPVDKSGSRVRQMFGEIAGRYDFMNHFLSAGTDVYWRWKTVRLGKPQGDKPILDVCTGTGDLAMAWRKRLDQRADVVGTDFTFEMLAIADRKKRDQAIRYLEADTMHLPFGDDVFQIVSVAFGLRNVSNTEAGLREMTRVCAPGGRVIVLEFSLPNNKLLSRTYKWYFRNVLPRLGQMLVRNRQAAYEYLPQSVSEFPYGQALADVMETSGLTNVSFHPLTGGIATIYVGHKPGEADRVS